MYRFTTTMSMLALSFGFQSAQADAPPDVPSQVVRFADLDLAHTQGAAVLYQRLQSAAAAVCAPLEDRAIVRHMKFRACVHSAIGRAVTEVDNPQLTSYYTAKLKGSNATMQVAQR